MKTHYLGCAMLCLAFAVSTVSAQEVVEFEGPDNARIYVLEGDFRETATFNLHGGLWEIEATTQATMNVNSGAMDSAGKLKISGDGYFNGTQIVIVMDMSFNMKSVVKQAGNAVRWSGTAALTGGMAAAEAAVGTPIYARMSGTYQYKDVTLDPATGEQTGTMSYNAIGVTEYGDRIPMSQPPTVMTFPRPTSYASEGDWREAGGDWSSEIVADVYPNGKITGAGDLIVGDPEDPYANVDQTVKGKLNSKTGVVSLGGTGATKGTSKVKVTLNYVNSTGDTVAGKSSVNAYAQKRKF